MEAIVENNGTHCRQAKIRICGLWRKIEPSAVRAILDLHNPKVGIKRDLPFEPLLGRGGIDGRLAVRPCEKSFDAGFRRGRDGLRRRLIERRAPVQMIDFHKNGASLGGAAAPEDGACPFHSAPAQIGRDPNVGAQAQRV